MNQTRYYFHAEIKCFDLSCRETYTMEVLPWTELEEAYHSLVDCVGDEITDNLLSFCFLSISPSQATLFLNVTFRTTYILMILI